MSNSELVSQFDTDTIKNIHQTVNSNNHNQMVQESDIIPSKAEFNDGKRELLSDDNQESSSENIGTTFISLPEWDPLETRIFDIYTNNDSSLNDYNDKKSALLDIFSDQIQLRITENQERNKIRKNNKKIGKEKITNKNSNSDISITSEINSDISEVNSPINNSPSIRKPHRNSATSTSSASTSTTTTTTNSKTFSLGKDNCDKWSTEVEETFMNSLRLIMKNGTAKIKVKDRNYGRNELISFYILFHTKEYRTKKQVSSHIQVWKKTILNKQSNDIPLTEREKELYDLIENGADQTKENTIRFHQEFDEIMQSLESKVINEKKHSRSQDYPDLLNITTKKRSISSNDGAINYHPTLITPDSAGFVSASQLSDNFDNPENYPVNALEYARTMYEKIPDYMCVPTRLEEKDIYVPCKTTDINEDNPRKDNNDHKAVKTNIDHEATLQRANDIKIAQRRIINNVNQSFQNVATTTASTNNNSNNASATEQNHNYINGQYIKNPYQTIVTPTTMFKPSSNQQSASNSNYMNGNFNQAPMYPNMNASNQGLNAQINPEGFRTQYSPLLAEPTFSSPIPLQQLPMHVQQIKQAQQQFHPQQVQQNYQDVSNYMSSRGQQWMSQTPQQQSFSPQHPYKFQYPQHLNQQYPQQHYSSPQQQYHHPQQQHQQQQRSQNSDNYHYQAPDFASPNIPSNPQNFPPSNKQNNH